MNDDRPKRESMSIEEATISNMWEIAAIVEVLERKGLCTKQDLYDIITEFRHKNPRASIPETAFPEPYLLTETENTIIDGILELLNKHGLTCTSRKTCWSAWGESLRWGSGWRRGRRTKSLLGACLRKRKTRDAVTNTPRRLLFTNSESSPIDGGLSVVDDRLENPCGLPVDLDDPVAYLAGLARHLSPANRSGQPRDRCT